MISDNIAPTEHTGAKAAKKKKNEKTNHLFRSHANCFDGELAAAEVEEVFQVRAQEVNNENIVETLLTKMVDLRNADCVASGENICINTALAWERARTAGSHTGAVQSSVRSIFIPKLRGFGFPRFLRVRISQSVIVLRRHKWTPAEDPTALKRTNLIATGVLVRILTPSRKHTMGGS